jgi:hypothetical protein
VGKLPHTDLATGKTKRKIHLKKERKRICLNQGLVLYMPKDELSVQKHRLTASIPRNLFLGSINVYKYGLRVGMGGGGGGLMPSQVVVA